MRLIRRIGLTVFGLFIFSFGVYMTICANIGLGPWDCLSMGLSYHVPFSYGAVHTAVSVAVLLVDLLMGERIGLGTVLDALLVGNFVDLFSWIGIVPVCRTVYTGTAVMCAGLVVMAVGQVLYMSAGLCCGPRDTLLVGLGKRLSRFPIGAVETLIMLIVLLAGWMLSGPVGIGTLIAGLGNGIAMQLVFSLLRFEPRKVHHDALRDTWRTLSGNG